jgi:putative FmdB family regulatory protein
MPTYDYECKACGHVFETMHAMSAPALRKCPECGKLKLVRLISGGAGVIFKGSGFYETDYKRNRRAADSAQDGGKKDADVGSAPSKGADEKAKADRPAEPSKSDADQAAKSVTRPKKDAASKKKN